MLNRDWIERAYDPETLRTAATKMVQRLCDHLASAHGGDLPVHVWNTPNANVAKAAEFLDRADRMDASDSPPSRAALEATADELASLMLARGQNLQQPMYIGHQVPAPVPLAGLFDLAMSVTNQVQGVYEMGPWAVSVERAVVERLGRKIGFETGTFSGIVTSGGSLANLTALLTARNHALAGSWEKGVQAPLPVLVTHGQAHYCVDRAAGILGIGTEQIVRVALDDQRRMDPAALQQTLEELAQEGRTVVAVVAVAGATPTGAYDRLHAIADVCQQHGVWLHVDAAHGGAACFSETHRHLVDGLARADSVVMDAHKMMFMPALCAMVFYREGQHRFGAFQQSAPYLFDPSAPGMAEYDNALVTVECTKRAAAMGLWAVWCMFGDQLFAAMVDEVFATAREFWQLLTSDPEFEVACKPPANIVVFRFQPAQHAMTEEELGALQLRIRRDLMESGELYVTQTKLDGRSYLRATVMNPLTSTSQLRSAIELMKNAGNGQASGGRP